MRVAALRYRLSADPATNRERLLDAAGGALRDADVVVGPEAATTGVDGPAGVAAEPLDGSTVTGLRRLVADSGGAVVAGLPERSGDGVANAAVVVTPDGVAVHRSPAAEFTYGWATRHGTDWAETVATPAGRVTVTLCAGLDRPDTAAVVAEDSPDLVAVPANRAESDRGPPLAERWAARAGTLGRPVAVGNVGRPADAASDGGPPFAFDGPAAVLAPPPDEVRETTVAANGRVAVTL